MGPILRSRWPAVARAVAEGLLAGGVLPVVKHMPGHGRSHVDTHLTCRRWTAPHEELRGGGFRAVPGAGDLPMAMTAHLVFAAWMMTGPRRSRPTMIRVIREEIGFRGC
jgi:beta-N-acetylhexosaminidase